MDNDGRNNNDICNISFCGGLNILAFTGILHIMFLDFVVKIKKEEDFMFCTKCGNCDGCECGCHRSRAAYALHRREVRGD
jgi:hypothetical protein